MGQPVGLFLAGLSFFLSGVAGLRSSLQRLGGRGLRRAIARVTDRRLSALVAGMVAGAVTQSASAVAFILSGMVATGVVTLGRSLPVVAAANLGTAALVFLAAIDLRLVALYLVGVCGLSRTSGTAPRHEAVLGALLSVGLLFFGLDLVKQAFAPLPANREFQELAASLRDWSLPALLLGGACRLFVQSSSAIGVIAVTLQSARIFSETQAMLLVCGAGLGVALSNLFLSSDLRGAPRQILVYQGLINLLSGLFFGAILWADRAAGTDLVPRALDHLASTPANRIAWVFLANMAGALAVGLAVLPWIESLLDRWEPPRPEAQASRPEFVHDGALDVPETAIALASREQQRLLALVSSLLDCVRSEARGDRDAVAMHEALGRLRGEIRLFLHDLVGRSLGADESEAVLVLERRQEHLDALEEAVHQFVLTRRTIGPGGRADELAERLTEVTSLFLVTGVEAWRGDETEIGHLLLMTEDRGETMERLRLSDLGTGGTQEQRSALGYAITLFERIAWLVRQLAISLEGAEEGPTHGDSPAEANR